MRAWAALALRVPELEELGMGELAMEELDIAMVDTAMGTDIASGLVLPLGPL